MSLILTKQLGRFRVHALRLASFTAPDCSRFGVATLRLSRYASDINDLPVHSTRNIGIIAHIDAGKTTTTERMLFYSGTTKHIGNVDQGDTVTDYLPAERDRGITIQSAAITIPWNGKKINIIDTPGHADFTFEVTRSLHVLDGAVTVLDAVAGVEAQTEKVWRQAAALNIPSVVFVNKMDRDGAGFSRTVKEVVSKLQTRVVLLTIPYFRKDASNDFKFCGVVDVLEKKLLVWDGSDDGTKVDVTELVADPADPEMAALYEECAKCREAAIETLGNYDEDLIDVFFETENYMAVPALAIRTSLKKATLARYATPVLCGASFRNIGVQPLLDAVVEYLPSPLQGKLPHVARGETMGKTKKAKRVQTTVPVAFDAKTGAMTINDNAKLSLSLAFKVITHPVRGILVFVRVYSGKLISGSKIINTRTGQSLKIGKLLLMHADQPREIGQLVAGNIGVITGTAGEVVTGDTIVAHAVTRDGVTKLPKAEQEFKLNAIDIPPPVYSSAIEPLTSGDRRRMEECLDIIVREDPSLHVSVDENTGSTLISGMGELHLEIVRDKLIKDMKARVEMGAVVVTYKETITTVTETTTKELPCDGSTASVSISLTVEGFEGESVDSVFAEDANAVLLELDNNIVIVSPEGAPQKVQEALAGNIEWCYQVQHSAIMSGIVSGVTAALQISGPIVKLPLHSVVVRVSEWNLPVEATNLKALLTCTRLAVVEAIGKLHRDQCTLLEPIMDVKVHVNDSDVGSIVQDLTAARNAVIESIDSDSENNLERMAWANDEASGTYVPYDPTMAVMKGNDIHGRQIVTAEAPLKEMLGYLSKLRSLTAGRGALAMDYKGMRRATRDRVESILSQ
ncbi:hypothetical protein BABINDRAFT_162373 [Babjeviella inositovora NRRL Y-12698]|uniref:Ribosome-releasing factor 2, mitochondrial n=1 Tax=Babjeviella inositovora NRRL Y-12698 TaxID=984486 RepID=A0A1E3QLT7_9ASCO|nr:uncharacterized protein BABINDRAFT_162373 [Babjeviella inositovora NRRL Y-12698]ODQ78669.1 hypothetical protein BABINDRAFT_162373 [Babjeviella inositovora NRRL Y-12698]